MSKITFDAQNLFLEKYFGIRRVLIETLTPFENGLKFREALKLLKESNITEQEIRNAIRNTEGAGADKLAQFKEIFPESFHGVKITTFFVENIKNKDKEEEWIKIKR